MWCHLLRWLHLQFFYEKHASTKKLLGQRVIPSACSLFIPAIQGKKQVLFMRSKEKMSWMKTMKTQTILEMHQRKFHLYQPLIYLHEQWICHTNKCQLLKAKGILKRPMFCINNKSLCSGCLNESLWHWRLLQAEQKFWFTPLLTCHCHQ